MINFFYYRVVFVDDDTYKVSTETGLVIGETIVDASNKLTDWYGENIVDINLVAADIEVSPVMTEKEFPETIAGARRDWMHFIDNYDRYCEEWEEEKNEE